MRLCIDVLFCVCLVLWAGCCPVKSSRKLGSDLTDMTNPEAKATLEIVKTTNVVDGEKKPVENKSESVDTASKQKEEIKFEAVTVNAEKDANDVQKNEEPKNDKAEVKDEQNKKESVVQKQESNSDKTEVKDESFTLKDNASLNTKEESKLDSAVKTEEAKAGSVSALSQNEGNNKTSPKANNSTAESENMERRDEPEVEEKKVDAIVSSKDADKQAESAGNASAEAENGEAKSENTLETSVEKVNLEDKNDRQEQGDDKQLDVVLEKPVDQSTDNNSETQQTTSQQTNNDGTGQETEKTTSSREGGVQDQVDLQLQELRNRNNEFEPLDDRRRMPNDDYDIMQELADLPSKFQETAGIVADHLRPDVLKWTDTSKEYFNLANQQISESFSPLVGKQYAPFIATMVSYGVLLLPLIVVIILFEHIKALFSLQKVLLFANIYLTAYFSTLWLAAFILGLEPMSFFYQNNLSNYLSLQLMQALGYIVYLILQTLSIITSCHSDTVVGKLTALLQWVVAMSVGLHYYVAVFHPAVASKPPHINWKIYAVYSVAFFILCLFARIRWMKKQYIVNNSVNKRN